MSLLYAIETCLRATGVPPSRFGREAVNDPRLVHDLRRGRQPGAAVERRVRQYIAEALAKSPTPSHSRSFVKRPHAAEGLAPSVQRGQF